MVQSSDTQKFCQILSYKAESSLGFRPKITNLCIFCAKIKIEEKGNIVFFLPESAIYFISLCLVTQILDWRIGKSQKKFLKGKLPKDQLY